MIMGNSAKTTIWGSIECFDLDDDDDDYMDFSTFVDKAQAWLQM